MAKKTRSCENCVGCCVYQPIVEIGKSALTQCEYLAKPSPPLQIRADGLPALTEKHYHRPTERNCTIYGDRPGPCVSYSCEWLLGAGEDEDRPDKCGIVFDRIERGGVLGNGVIAKQLWLDAYTSENARTAIERVSNDLDEPVLLAQFAEQRILTVVGRGVKWP